MKTSFKNIVLISYILYVICFFLPFFDEYLLDQSELDALSWIGYGSIIPLDNVISFFFFIAYTTLALGLIYFKPWAKALFTMTVMLSIIATFISGIAVHTAIEETLIYITLLADGAILSMLYLSEIKLEFKDK